MAAQNDDSLKVLTEQAAASLGPIASILVEQAAADGAGLEDIRKRVAAQMDADARERFLRATEGLAAKSRPKPAAPEPAKAASAAAANSPAAAAPVSSETLDRSDPAFIKALARDLAARLGPQGETMVLEASRRCRTKMQLCIRLSSQVTDPELKTFLAKLALDDPRVAARKT